MRAQNLKRREKLIKRNYIFGYRSLPDDLVFRLALLQQVCFWLFYRTATMQVLKAHKNSPPRR